MTSKWGSCSTRGTITLARELANREAGFQDYVIAHELLHMRHPNHGKVFKALMTVHVPQWRKYKGVYAGQDGHQPDGSYILDDSWITAIPYR